MNIIKSVPFIFRHLNRLDKFIVISLITFFVIGAVAALVHPAFAGLGLVSLAFAPVGDFYDPGAANDAGSNIWYFRRIDKATQTVVNLGQVAGVKVMSGGSGYTTAPTVAIAAPASGTTALATAYIANGKVVEIRMTNKGSGYVSTDVLTVTLTGGGGAGAIVKAFWSDGWHLGPGRAKSDFEAGQDEKDVIGEDKQIFSTIKDIAKGILQIDVNQTDTWTTNFFGKEATLYDWQIFWHRGITRNSDINSYIFIGVVRFPKKVKIAKMGDIFTINGVILQNKSAISITNSTDLPVTGLVGAYSLAAKELYSENEETIEPTLP